MLLPGFVCLSVSLLAFLRNRLDLLKNACMDLDEMLRCVSTDVGTWTNWFTFEPEVRIIVRTPEPDCFLRYRMRCNAEFCYVGKIARAGIWGIGRPSLQRGVVLKWFYSPRAVGTPLSQVNALYRLPFQFVRSPIALFCLPRQRRYGKHNGCRTNATAKVSYDHARSLAL